VSYEKNKEVQENKLFSFCFSMYHPDSLNHLSLVRPYEKLTAAEVAAVAGTTERPGRRHLSSVINNSLLATSKQTSYNKHVLLVS